MIATGGRGYFAIGVYRPKNEVNIGTLFRSAAVFGASYTFTIGRRYSPQSSDTMKSWRHMPHFNYKTIEEFQAGLPYDAMLIGVEMHPESSPIDRFCHPRSAVYLLGSEDDGLPPNVLAACQRVICLPGEYSLNVAVAGSIVLFDRFVRAPSLSALRNAS